MATTFTDGTITTNASEQDIVNVTSDAHFALWVFTHNMQAGDSVTIKIYIKDQNGASMRLFDTVVLSDVQDNPAYYIPFLATKQYQVSIQRTLGTDRAYTWQRVTVT